MAPGPPFVLSLPTRDAFDALAAEPFGRAHPGARSLKTVIDLGARSGDDTAPPPVYYMNTRAYPTHKQFAIDHLGWVEGAPFVPQYVSPDRRFLLGSITYYAQADVWAYDIAPYDKSSVAMIERAIERVVATSFLDSLRFHVTSAQVGERAAALSIPTITTGELYAGSEYQPLVEGEAVGRLRIVRTPAGASALSASDVAVLAFAPNDMPVVAASITAQFQTPLSHLNVLSRSRGTPNMALRSALDRLGSLDGAWVRLVVAPDQWTIAKLDADEASAARAAAPRRRIEPVAVDLSRTALLDLDEVTLADIAAVGGKAAHLGELRDIGGVHSPRGFAIPFSYYHRFLAETGLDARVRALLADPRVAADREHRRAQLRGLREAIRAAPIPAALERSVRARIAEQFGETRMRFRSSTNAEDLGAYTGAGLYRSASGALGDPKRPIAAAIKRVWASVWGRRAFEERAHLGIPHEAVMMAVLVHPAYLDERANGVAITANTFDPRDDAFYLNVQRGEAPVVSPDPDLVPDEILFYSYHAGQPTAYLRTSSLPPRGVPVLDAAQLRQLGFALQLVRMHFKPHYPGVGGIEQPAMDVEFKLVETPDGSRIELKQARPFPLGSRGHDD